MSGINNFQYTSFWYGSYLVEETAQTMFRITNVRCTGPTVFQILNEFLTCCKSTYFAIAVYVDSAHIRQLQVKPISVFFLSEFVNAEKGSNSEDPFEAETQKYEIKPGRCDNNNNNNMALQ